MQNEIKRERTFSWDKPLEGAAQAMHISGTEYLQAMTDGSLPLPPLMHTLDFQIGSLMPGNVTFTFTPKEFHYNPIGTVHGGVISAILDSAMGCSLHSLLSAGTGYTTLELKVNFLKAVTIQSGELKAVGKVISKGSRTALAEAQLLDDAGNIYAHAVSTCLIMQMKKAE